MAESAYREAAELLDPQAEPELWMQLERGQVLRLRAEGRYPEALDGCRRALEFAGEHGLEFWSARVTQIEASLLLRVGPVAGLEERIRCFRPVHQVWESKSHLVLCDLLEAASRSSQPDSGPFRQSYDRFLEGFREPGLQELMGGYPHEVGLCVARALRDGGRMAQTAELMAAAPAAAVARTARSGPGGGAQVPDAALSGRRIDPHARDLLFRRAAGGRRAPARELRRHF